MKSCLGAPGYGAVLNMVLRIYCFYTGTIGKMAVTVNIEKTVHGARRKVHEKTILARENAWP
jgi:hypothetical protein